MGYGSTLDIHDVCLQGSNWSLPIFGDHDTTIQSSRIYAEGAGEQTDPCEGNGVLQGDRESTCFTSSLCSGVCLPFDAEECSLSSWNVPVLLPESDDTDFSDVSVTSSAASLAVIDVVISAVMLIPLCICLL